MQESSPVVSTQGSPSAKVAYIVSGFPTLYETFVLYDLLAMEELGVSVDLYPLRRTYPKIVHPEAQRWIDCAHYHPYISRAIFCAQWHFIRRDPLGYLKLWAEVLRGTWGSIRYFLGAIAIFPKTVLFAHEMNEGGIAHVHAHFANHPAVAALIIHRLTGIPFSFTARGSDVQVDRRMLKEKVEAAEFAVAVSSDNKRIIIDECGPNLREKIYVIRGGVDVERLSPPPTSRSTGLLRIVCVARFEEVKGHTYLVEACRILRERGISLECRLIGDGPLLRTIKAQIEMGGLCEQIQLRGPRRYQDVIQELLQADVVVLPTAPTAAGNREGMPTVLQEAMACGLPVVASHAGGIPELVDDMQTGILVPARNAGALADALQLLHDDPALRLRLGRAGRDKIVREFNLKVNTAKRAKLFARSASVAKSLSGWGLTRHSAT